MTAGRSDRRAVQIRRRGRHSSPSQVEKVAQQAGKAAPAVAIAGALVAVPGASQALAATATPAAATAVAHQSTAATAAVSSSATMPRASLDSFEAKTVTVAAAKPAKHAATSESTYYTVRSGDTLSKIASRFYHEASDWQYLYQANEKTVHNPDMIYAGERLLIPATVSTQSAYAPKHSKPTATTESTSAKQTGKETTPRKTVKETTPKKTVAKKTKTTTKHTVVVQRSASGDYSCAGLEELWEQAGGSASTAFMAAEIAKAESGGNPNAISPTDDFGLWQINAVNGSLATLSPTGNAHSAVVMSDNGRDWNAWTTYHSGAYYGRC